MTAMTKKNCLHRDRGCPHEITAQHASVLGLPPEVRPALYMHICIHESICIHAHALISSHFFAFKKTLAGPGQSASAGARRANPGESRGRVRPLCPLCRWLCPGLLHTRAHTHARKHTTLARSNACTQICCYVGITT